MTANTSKLKVLLTLTHSIMYTFTKHTPELAEQINAIDLEHLLENASNSAKSFEPRIIFISEHDWFSVMSDLPEYSCFSCSSVHEFLRIGLHHYPCVIITIQDRAECSSSSLRQILSTRIKKPCEVLTFQNTTENQVIETIKAAYQRVQNLMSVEHSISQEAEKFITGRFLSPMEIAQNIEPPVMHKIKISEKLIRSRVADLIQTKPEEFLREAIDQIRKPSSNF